MAQKERRPIRKLRHWKQRFDRNAEFIWRRPTEYGDWTYESGESIPEQLANNPTKLRRFWESGRIELAEFEMPDVTTGQVESDDDWLDGGAQNGKTISEPDKLP
ncbi:MAG: hypothetical protein V3S55_15470 [Nitrospiraceae bacterium]